jgi:hypothetical protein
MLAIVAQSLLLGSAKLAPQLVSLNPAAWSPLSDRGLIDVQPLAGTSPAVVVTISAAGRAASLLEPTR